MKVVIASKNPVKIQAVKTAFLNMFLLDDIEFIPLDVKTKTPDQPVGDKQTLQGAATRAMNAFKDCIDTDNKGDYYIGIEGGIDFTLQGVVSFAYTYIRSKEGILNYTKTPNFVLPPAVGDLIGAGMELGDADDIVFKDKNSKQKNGAVGILTKGLINRTAYYTQALILALIPYANKELYKKTPIQAKTVVTNSKPCPSC